MAITEQDRRDLFNGLEEAIGTQPANKLMELLPNQPAEQLVTRTDMHAFGAELRGEMAELRAELRTEMGEFRTELRDDLRSEIRQIDSKMADLKSHTTRVVLGGAAVNVVAVLAAAGLT